MATLQEIGAQHWSGYVAYEGDSLVGASSKTTYSFCNGRIVDVRINNMVIGRLDTIMDSNRDKGYYLCDKDRKRLTVH